MEAGADRIKAILADDRAVAVVGASPNPSRPSYKVMRFLLENGYRVIPVRPRVKEILGQPCYGSLAEIPEEIGIVDVFRRPDACPAVAAEAVTVGARTLWLQQGIVSVEAAAIARAAGLEVVMDRCIKVAHQELNQ